MNDATWASNAIDCCLENGVDHFFIAPGSRCTPLTLAAAREPRITITQHFDERGLAFAALGYGRAVGRPGVFICTSGTAVANAFPAVIEASMESVPLLLFTADRPEELIGTGANQTIDQQAIFGGYPRLFLSMPAPEDAGTHGHASEIIFLRQQLTNAFTAARRGPAHTNWMFREPFTIDDSPLETQPIETSKTSDRVQTKPEPRIPEKNEQRGSFPIKVSSKTLIALGGCRPEEAEQALALSQRLQCPLLSDITSGLRTGSFEVCSLTSLPQPDTILHLGGRIVSKTWLNWTAGLAKTDVDYFHLTPTGQTINPHGLKIEKICASLDNLNARISGGISDEEFSASWQTATEERSAAIARVLDDTDQLDTPDALSEPALAYSLSKHCPPDKGLLLGNSTPIRDMDWFGVSRDGAGGANSIRQVAANRGASGIDGLIATAVGYAAGLRKMTTIVLGDLSALHDLNSLSLVANAKYPLIVLVINNQGGHIFDLLPISKSQHFEQFFATPHPYHFEQAAKMFGIAYRQVSDLNSFVDSYQEALSGDKSIVLEALTDRRLNQRVRKQLRDEIQRCSVVD